MNIQLLWREGKAVQSVDVRTLKVNSIVLIKLHNGATAGYRIIDPDEKVVVPYAQMEGHQVQKYEEEVLDEPTFIIDEFNKEIRIIEINETSVIA